MFQLEHSSSFAGTLWKTRKSRKTTLKLERLSAPTGTYVRCVPTGTFVHARVCAPRNTYNLFQVKRITGVRRGGMRVGRIAREAGTQRQGVLIRAKQRQTAGCESVGGACSAKGGTTEEALTRFQARRLRLCCVARKNGERPVCRLREVKYAISFILTKRAPGDRICA
jgi:hypothetical protein